MCFSHSGRAIPALSSTPIDPIASAAAAAAAAATADRAARDIELDANFQHWMDNRTPAEVEEQHQMTVAHFKRTNALLKNEARICNGYNNRQSKRVGKATLTTVALIMMFIIVFSFAAFIPSSQLLQRVSASSFASDSSMSVPAAPQLSTDVRRNRFPYRSSALGPDPITVNVAVTLPVAVPIPTTTSIGKKNQRKPEVQRTKKTSNSINKDESHADINLKIKQSTVDVPIISIASAPSASIFSTAVPSSAPHHVYPDIDYLQLVSCCIFTSQWLAHSPSLRRVFTCPRDICSSALHPTLMAALVSASKLEVDIANSAANMQMLDMMRVKIRGAKFSTTRRTSLSVRQQRAKRRIGKTVAKKGSFIQLTSSVVGEQYNLWDNGDVRYRYSPSVLSYATAVSAAIIISYATSMHQWEVGTGIVFIRTIHDQNPWPRNVCCISILDVIALDEQRNGNPPTSHTDFPGERHPDPAIINTTVRVWVVVNSKTLLPTSLPDAAHELGHLIGLHHVMSRQDRDRYITVNHQDGSMCIVQTCTGAHIVLPDNAADDDDYVKNEVARFMLNSVNHSIRRWAWRMIAEIPQLIANAQLIGDDAAFETSLQVQFSIICPTTPTYAQFQCDMIAFRKAMTRANCITYQRHQYAACTERCSLPTTPYEFASVMHYEFGSNRCYALAPGVPVPAKIGNSAPTALDLQAVCQLYECGVFVTATGSAQSVEHGPFVNWLYTRHFDIDTTLAAMRQQFVTYIQFDGMQNSFTVRMCIYS